MVARVSKRTIKPHEDISLFPGYIRQVGHDHWRLEISGAVYDPYDVTLRKRILLRVLTRVMKIDRAELQTDMFRERIRTFVASSERGRRVAVRIGEQIYQLQKKSKRNGHFSGSLQLSQSEIDSLIEQGQLVDDWLTYRVVTGEQDDRELIGKAQLLGAQGISVVSDIDDTIKFTDVSTRREMVANTFFREFRGIDAIASVYQEWASRGAAFHYVSSSPWQLMGPLQELFQALELPSGTMHLRNVLLRDQMLKRVMLFRRKGKAAAIRKLLEDFPQRKFVLIGDSRERDPEIYAKLCHKFSPQVLAIWIREWEDCPLHPERMSQIDQRCGKQICHAFLKCEELATLAAPIFSMEMEQAV
jgi:phosphatidate phosphatase APP1